MSVSQISSDTCFIRGTHAKKGRNEWLSPASGAVRELHYGRIILDKGAEPVLFGNGGHETGLICLNGQAEVTAGGSTLYLEVYDSIYVPRHSQIPITDLP